MWPCGRSSTWEEALSHVLNYGSVITSPGLGRGRLRSLMSFAGNFRAASATSWDQSFVSATCCCLAHLNLKGCQRNPWGVRKCGHVFCVFPAANHGIWWICNYLGVWFIFMKRCLFTCREPQVAKQPLQFCIVLPEATLVCWLPFKFLALPCLSHTMHLSTPYRSFDWWFWWCLTFDVWSALSSWGCQGDGMS